MQPWTAAAVPSRGVRAFGALALLALAVLLPARSFPWPATVRPDGLLEVDGEPFFPVGLVQIAYGYYVDWNDQIRRSGANVVWETGYAYRDSVPSCHDVLDSARAAGYKLILGSPDTYNWDDPETPELEVDQLLYEVEDIPPLLQCIAADPGPVIGFVNRDEPSWTISKHWIGDVDAAHIRWTYYQLHQVLGAGFVAMNFAPVHVSGDIEQWKNDLLPFLDATDVVMTASYPYPAMPDSCSPSNVFDYPACRMDRLAMAADTFLGELNHPGQPLWMIVQAHKGIPLKEARWEAHTAIVHGATGILWAGWNWYHRQGDGRESWPAIVRVISETAALQRFLVGADLPVTTDQPDVEARAKEAGPETAVFAISRNAYAGPATLHLPGLPPGSRRVEVWGESRVLAAQDGALTDSFQAYESHVYVYRGRSEKVHPDSSRAHAPAGGLAVSARPNPTSGPTVVHVELSGEATVLVTVHDAAGRHVATVGRRSWAGPSGEVAWDGRDLRGRRVADGVYFVRVAASDGRTATGRVLVRR